MHYDRSSNYSKSYAIDFPLDNVTICSDDGRSITASFIVDTGSSISAIPGSMISRLCLRSEKYINIRGVKDKAMEVDLYFVTLKFSDGTLIKNVKVIETLKERPLLGTNVLAQIQTLKNKI